MSNLHKIISLLLVLAITNVYVGKAIHELVEHDHVAHECEHKGTTHFHESEQQHVDLICSFQISTSFFDRNGFRLGAALLYLDAKALTPKGFFVKDFLLKTTPLRGPPMG